MIKRVCHLAHQKFRTHSTAHNKNTGKILNYNIVNPKNMTSIHLHMWKFFRRNNWAPWEDPCPIDKPGFGRFHLLRTNVNLVAQSLLRSSSKDTNLHWYVRTCLGIYLILDIYIVVKIQLIDTTVCIGQSLNILHASPNWYTVLVYIHNSNMFVFSRLGALSCV
jgi:hypothetical protein